MGTVTEVFDVKQHPQRDGETSTLEKRITAIEKRFAAVYPQEQVGGFPGFRTEQGTAFHVNGIYEWNTVFLEFDDGEDGDMVPMDIDEETMFNELHQEILVCEKDERMAQELSYRIYKNEKTDDGMLIHFRFPGSYGELSSFLSAHNNVVVDGQRYVYRVQQINDRVLGVSIDMDEDKDLYDHWIRFEG